MQFDLFGIGEAYLPPAIQIEKESPGLRGGGGGGEGGESADLKISKSSLLSLNHRDKNFSNTELK